MGRAEWQANLAKGAIEVFFWFSDDVLIWDGTTMELSFKAFAMFVGNHTMHIPGYTLIP